MMKIQVGTAYYPEAWQKERIILDAALMKKAGITCVRLGEFAWSHMEKTDGIFDFQWLHDAVKIFAEYDIKTVMCTPSSAAPAWLCKKYPEVLRTGRTGEKAWFGVRDHTCYTSAIYRKYLVRLVRKMAEEFQNEENIIAWQIDNELGCSRFSECFCEECQNSFRRFLRKKFRSIENLNKCWATTFWSGEYTSWDEVELEGYSENMGAGRTLASAEFRSANGKDFLSIQAKEIRKRIPHAVIGTNNLTRYDRYEGFAGMDFAAEDFYPTAKTPAAEAVFRTDLYRGILPGKSPWMLETPPGPGAPLQDLTKLFFWLFAGHGYDHIFYFLWVNHPAGNEKTHKTVLTQYGQPGVLYERISSMIHEADKLLEGYDTLPQVESSTALVYDYHASWIYTMSFRGEEVAYTWQQRNLHEALFRTGYTPQILSSKHDFSPYKLVTIPLHAHVEKSFAEKLEKYVKEGGVVLMNGRSGMYDGYSKNLTESGPQHLKKLFGMEMHDGLEYASQGYMPDYPPACQHPGEKEKHHIVAEGNLNGKKVYGCADHWVAGIKLTTAEAPVKFRNSIYRGMPFLTVNRFGKGYAVYCAADMVDKELMREIVLYCESLAHLPEKNIPENVDISRRGKLLFVTNFNNKDITFPTEYKGKNKMGKALQKGCFKLKAWETAIIELT